MYFVIQGNEMILISISQDFPLSGKLLCEGLFFQLWFGYLFFAMIVDCYWIQKTELSL